MSYIVDRIPGQIKVDPDAGGRERRPKRDKPGARQDGDSVTISEEARRRSAGEAGGAGEGAG